MVEPLGVPHRRVVLVPYQETWAKLYIEERDRIKAVWGEVALDIEHVGSTSIPGIHAKPIIDIVIAVNELSDSDRMQNKMESLGYDYPRDVGIPGECVYGKGGPRTHIVHVTESRSSQWLNYLLFRDSLRSNAGLAQEYQQLKLALAEKYAEDRAKYTDRKASFVRKVVESN